MQPQWDYFQSTLSILPVRNSFELDNRNGADSYKIHVSRCAHDMDTYGAREGVVAVIVLLLPHESMGLHALVFLHISRELFRLI